MVLAGVCIGLYLHSIAAGAATLFILNVLAPERIE